MKRWGTKNLLILALGVVLGCASGSILVTGNKRTPISPDMVVLYTTPPPEYEVIGQIIASSDEAFSSQQGRLDYAVKRLKKEAAQVGANGVLLKYHGLKSGDSTGVFVPSYGGGGMFYAASSEEMVVRGDAIWVPADSISNGESK